MRPLFSLVVLLAACLPPPIAMDRNADPSDVRSYVGDWTNAAAKSQAIEERKARRESFLDRLDAGSVQCPAAQRADWPGASAQEKHAWQVDCRRLDNLRDGGRGDYD